MPVPVLPPERAPLLRVFGGLAEQIAVLVRLRPTLAQRLVFAPPQAVHAVAAYLHHGVPANLSYTELAEIIETHHPRDLLIRTFPQAPVALYKAFGRSSDRACEPKTYLRAAALSCGPFAAAFLSGNPLHHRRLDYYEALSTFDRTVAAMQHTLPENAATAEAVHNIVSVLRAYRPLTDADVALPPSAGRRAVLRRLHQLLDSIRAPVPPFAVPAPLRLIETVGALRREGLRFKNCIRDQWHGPRLWLGHARGDDVFIVSDGPCFIAHFRCVAPSLYFLNQIAGPSNAKVEIDVQESLIATLRRAGANIIDSDPAYALSRLYSDLCAGTRAEDDDDGLDAVLDAALDDLAA